jgi:hypothetical protein
MLLNAYLICLRCTRGSTIKRKVQLGGASLGWKDTFSIYDKGERFIRCRGQMHDSRGSNGHRDAEDKCMVLGGA